MSAVLASALFFSLISVLLLIRNECVFRYRMRLIGRIHNVSQGEPDWRWRYDELDAVPYARMVIVPLPFDRFYPRDPARAER